MPEKTREAIAITEAWIHNLNTDTARQMAQERYAFMKAFTNQVRRELASNS